MVRFMACQHTTPALGGINAAAGVVPRPVTAKSRLPRVGHVESAGVSTVTADQVPSLSGWRNYVRNLWRWREFGWFLAMGNLKARNASTSLGLVWWMLNPLIMAAVYFLVFGLILGGRRGEPQFIAWLLSGVFAFNYTATAMTSGANSILANRRLLVNIRFPRLILPISAVIETGVGFLMSIAVYYLIVWPADGVSPGVTLLWLPAAVALHTVFNLGLAGWTARLAIPFRDINNLMPHLTRLWLYLSPIIWPLSFLRDRGGLVEDLAVLNPMYGILSFYRMALMGRDLETGAFVLALLWTLLIGGGGILSFVRHEGNMVRHL